MILGIGNDIVEVERVKTKILKENGFREAIFSTKEINYCESKINPYESYAVRFAAKEAFLKAIGMGILQWPNLNQIEIINDFSGKPELYLSEKMLDTLSSKKIGTIHLTMSHTKDFATAAVVIESKEI